ncbi:MAG: hypothetical protein KJN82_06200 [Bacteroidia bacterium]|nr:hypothetical protein [Bacteroidia bacterium]
MKNLKVKLLAGILLLGPLSIHATTITNESVTVLKYEDVKEGYRVVIKDNFGVVLYKETIQNEGNYVKGFDLTTLPEGDYSFELEKDFEIKVKPFKVTNNKVEFLKNENYSIFKPVITKKKGYVYISQLAFENDVKIEILNNDSVIHSELVENQMELRKIFDFTEAPINDYTVIVKTKDRSFINNIKL